MVVAAATADKDLDRRVEHFLYREAALLDGRHFSQWLELFTEDAQYRLRAPELVGTGVLNSRPPEPNLRVLIDDDRGFMALRVARLERGLAGCEIPASITRHVVTNVFLDGVQANEVTVCSNFMIYQNRTEDHVIIGSRRDVLRTGEGKLAIAVRDAVLDHRVSPRTLSVFV